MSDDHPVASALQRSLDAIVRGDIDAYAATLTEDSIGDDRRLALAGIRDRDASIQQAQFMSQQMTDASVHFIEGRGERLALVRLVAHAADYEFAGLCVAKIDPSGRICLGVYFDDNDEAAATEELDAQSATSD